MRLPDTNSIDLPETNEGWIAIDDDEPVPEWDIEALRRFLPAYLQADEDTLRDAFLKAWGRMTNTARAEITRIMAAQTSPRFAWGLYLEEHGEEMKVRRIAGETEAQYRERLLLPRGDGTPRGVVAALRELCAPEGVGVWVQEPFTDGMFASGANSRWKAYCSGATRRNWSSKAGAPEYVRVGGFVEGLPYAPRVRVIIRATPARHGKVCYASGPTRGPNAAGYATGASKWNKAFVARGASLGRRVAAELKQRLVGGVKWTIYYEPLA